MYGLCALSEPLGDMSQTKFTDMSACARCFFFEVSTPGWFELRTLKSAEIRYGDERERKAGIRSADPGGEYDKIALNEDRLE